MGKPRSGTGNLVELGVKAVVGAAFAPARPSPESPLKICPALCSEHPSTLSGPSSLTSLPFNSSENLRFMRSSGGRAAGHGLRVAIPGHSFRGRILKNEN